MHESSSNFSKTVSKYSKTYWTVSRVHMRDEVVTLYARIMKMKTASRSWMTKNCLSVVINDTTKKTLVKSRTTISKIGELPWTIWHCRIKSSIKSRVRDRTKGRNLSSLVGRPDTPDRLPQWPVVWSCRPPTSKWFPLAFWWKKQYLIIVLNRVRRRTPHFHQFQSSWRSFQRLLFFPPSIARRH